MLDVCVKAVDVKRALSIFEDMKKNECVDIISYNTMLKACLGVRTKQLASECGLTIDSIMKDMRAAGLQPNDITYNSLINAAVGSGDGHKAWMWVDEMVEAGIECIFSINNACFSRSHQKTFFVVKVIPTPAVS